MSRHSVDHSQDAFRGARVLRPFVLVFCFVFQFVFCGLPTPASAVNYDESKVPVFTLPDPLVCDDGSTVKVASDWTGKRRAEVLAHFQNEMYGFLPEILAKAGNHPDFVTFRLLEASDDALDGKALRKQIEITFTNPQKPGEKATANLLLYIPKNASAPVPAFLGLNFWGNHSIADDPAIIPFHDRYGNVLTEDNLPKEGVSSRAGKSSRWLASKLIENGYALATMHYVDIANDSLQKGFRTGVFKLYSEYENDASRAPADWGSITAWAWGLSRALDYLETEKLIDAKKVAVLGHSRLGKTALWAGATDERFALVISNDSGCGGAALSRREFGETIQIMSDGLRYWFCPNFRKFGPRVNDFSIDQHELIALAAPRPVYVASAKEDLWADPKGEYLSCLYAAPVYELLGFENPFGERTVPELSNLNVSVGNIIGYHVREGKHDLTEFDWDQYLRFADKFLK